MEFLWRNDECGRVVYLSFYVPRIHITSTDKDALHIHRYLYIIYEWDYENKLIQIK